MEIGTLERVSIRTLWPREDRDFTPWLANHLDVLGKELNLLDLELDRTEVNFGRWWGQVDIKAKRGDDETTVVIENQYGDSNDDHFWRLLKYATRSNAEIVVLVAERIIPQHRYMIDWLNRGDTIDFYAVEVEGWRIGPSTAPWFRAVVVPERDEISSTQRDGTQAWHTGSAYANFYRPVAERLRQEAGIIPVGKGGWRGRYRSFRTGYEEQGIVYYLSLDQTTTGDPGAWAGFQVWGRHSEEFYEALHDALKDAKSHIAGSEMEWTLPSDESRGKAWLGVSQVADSLPELLNDPGPTREWMFENLGKIKEAVQPHLDRIMSELQPGDDQTDGETLSEIPSEDDLREG